MKYIVLSILALTTFFSQAQITAKVSGNIFDLNVDSVYISHYVKGGRTFNDFLSAPFNKKDGTFSLEGELPLMDYYMLRLGDKVITLIIRNKSDIQIYGDGKNLDAFLNIVNSAESKNLNDFGLVVANYKYKTDEAKKTFGGSSAEEQKKIQEQMTLESKRFMSEQRGFIARNPKSPALYAALSSIDPEKEFGVYEDVMNQLNGCFSQSPTIQELNKRYKAYKIQFQAKELISPGKKAPDFEELNIDRKTTTKLSDLKGKVVLIDFWASWCRPCRAENPNVVRLYNEYKDKGFTVMSVSLDRDLNAWLNAIKKDGLTWPNHVSDLKHWSSAVAKIYGVRGIPYTVLIDEEGTIIAINLRGADLENKLAEIFAK